MPPNCHTPVVLYLDNDRTDRLLPAFDRKVQPLADGSGDEADEFGRKRPDEPDIRPRQIYCELNTCLRRS